MTHLIQIGFWNEAAARQETYCPSYYAADTETIETVPGRYPLYMEVRGGYTCPMPGDTIAHVDAVRVSGRLYSGMGGNNFASEELPAGEKMKYSVRGYASNVGKDKMFGTIELLPEFEALRNGDFVAFGQSRQWGAGVLARTTTYDALRVS